MTAKIYIFFQFTKGAEGVSSRFQVPGFRFKVQSPGGANAPDGLRHLAEKREENRKLFRQERGLVQTELKRSAFELV